MTEQSTTTSASAAQELSRTQRHNSLALLSEIGFPDSLLVQCLPHDASGIVLANGSLDNSSPGKAPAYWDHINECWRGSRWKKGLLKQIYRELGDRRGANAGLVLGNADADLNLIALDLDLACDTAEETERAVMVLAQVYRFLNKQVGFYWCRQTRRGRGLVIFRLPRGEPAGSKDIVHLAHPQDGNLGKCEILSLGEQAVVAGIHHLTKQRITWMRTDRPSDIRFAPDIDEGIPLLPSRAAFNELLDEMLADLATTGITYSRGATTKPKIEAAERPRNGNQTSPGENAAPSVKALLSLLRDLPNPPNAGRDDTYLKVLNGNVGCVRAARGLDSISKAEETAVAHAWALWASCWDAPPGQQAGTYEFELGKFNAELERPGVVFSGWQTLLNVAMALGMTDPEGFFQAEPAPEGQPEPTTEGLGPRGRKPSVQFLKLKDIAELPPQDWLVDDLVPAVSLVCAYGAPKAGKTFLLLSMGLHIATGLPWMGKKTRQGAIVYIVGEGARGLQKRLEAQKKHYGIGDEAPFYVIGRAVNFTDKKAVRELREDIEDLMVAEGQTLAAIMVDTVARAMPGADENAVKEMGVFILGCDQLRERLGCTVFAIHHSGKDISRGARGSNSLLGAVDGELVVEKKDRVCTLTVTEMRDGESGEVMTFDMLPIGTSDGKSTLVPVLRAEVPMSQKGAPPVLAKLSGDQELLMSALEETLKTSGEDQDGTRICTVKAWRTIYYSRRSGDEPDAMQKGFKRARDALIAKSRIEVRDPYVWIRTSWSEAGEFSATEVHELRGLLTTAPPTSDAIN